MTNPFPPNGDPVPQQPVPAPPLDFSGAPQQSVPQVNSPQPVQYDPQAPGNPVPGQPIPGNAYPGNAYPAAPVPPPAPPAKSKGKGLLMRIGGVLVVVAIAFLVRTWMNGGFDKEAVAGDCIGAVDAPATGETTDVDSVDIVDCTSAEAAYVVEGKVEGVSELQFSLPTTNVCADAGFDTEYQYWSGRKGKDGYVLCLNPKS